MPGLRPKAADSGLEKYFQGSWLVKGRLLGQSMVAEAWPLESSAAPKFTKKPAAEMELQLHRKGSFPESYFWDKILTGSRWAQRRAPIQLDPTPPTSTKAQTPIATSQSQGSVS